MIEINTSFSSSARKLLPLILILILILFFISGLKFIASIKAASQVIIYLYMAQMCQVAEKP